MVKKIKTFHIIHEGTQITLQTEHTKFHSLKELMFAIVRYYEQKRPDEMERFMKLLNYRYEQFKLNREYEKQMLEKRQRK